MPSSALLASRLARGVTVVEQDAHRARRDRSAASNAVQQTAGEIVVPM